MGEKNIYIYIYLITQPIEEEEKINNATSSNLYRSYYPHRSRDLVSPLCRIFFFLFYYFFLKARMHISMVLVLLSASVERFGVSCRRYFFTRTVKLICMFSFSEQMLMSALTSYSKHVISKIFYRIT